MHVTSALSSRGRRLAVVLAGGAVLLGVPAAAGSPRSLDPAAAPASAPVTDLEADGDGDGLLNGWEINGYDADGDGTIDVDLPALGADPQHKDVFVEMDYMGAEDTCPCYLPQASTLDRIVEVFATSPEAANPDGTQGIRLHLDAGPGRTEAYDLGGGNLVPVDLDLDPVADEFDAIKAANFDPAREAIFHYMLWAHGFDGKVISGFSFGVPGDSFLVTLGGFPRGGDADAKVGTFVHELGHNLGLMHGGTDEDNYKPNYQSVMSYAFQLDGVPRTRDRDSYFGYSAAKLPTLVERRLVEPDGLAHPAAKPYRPRWVCPFDGLITTTGKRSAVRPINWDCDGRATDTVSVDVSADGWLTRLEGAADWGHLVYDGGTIGPGATAPGPWSDVRELSLDEYDATVRRD